MQTEFAQSSSFTHRKSFIMFCTEIVTKMSFGNFIEHFFELYLQMAQDKVSDVKIQFLNSVCHLRPYLELIPNILNQFNVALSGLLNDQSQYIFEMTGQIDLKLLKMKRHSDFMISHSVDQQKINHELKLKEREIVQEELKAKNQEALKNKIDLIKAFQLAGMYNIGRTKGAPVSSVNSLYFGGLLKKGSKAQLIKKPSIQISLIKPNNLNGQPSPLNNLSGNNGNSSSGLKDQPSSPTSKQQNPIGKILANNIITQLQSLKEEPTTPIQNQQSSSFLSNSGGVGGTNLIQNAVQKLIRKKIKKENNNSPVPPQLSITQNIQTLKTIRRVDINLNNPQNVSSTQLKIESIISKSIQGKVVQQQHQSKIDNQAEEEYKIQVLSAPVNAVPKKQVTTSVVKQSQSMSPVKNDMHQLMNEIPILANAVLGQALAHQGVSSNSAQNIVSNSIPNEVKQILWKNSIGKKVELNLQVHPPMPQQISSPQVVSNSSQIQQNYQQEQIIPFQTSPRIMAVFQEQARALNKDFAQYRVSEANQYNKQYQQSHQRSTRRSPSLDFYLTQHVQKSLNDVIDLAIVEDSPPKIEINGQGVNESSKKASIYRQRISNQVQVRAPQFISLNGSPKNQNLSKLMKNSTRQVNIQPQTASPLQLNHSNQNHTFSNHLLPPLSQMMKIKHMKNHQLRNNRTNEITMGTGELQVIKLNGIGEILSAEINSYKPISKTKRAQSQTGIKHPDSKQFMVELKKNFSPTNKSIPQQPFTDNLIRRSEQQLAIMSPLQQQQQPRKQLISKPNGGVTLIIPPSPTNNNYQNSGNKKKSFGPIQEQYIKSSQQLNPSNGGGIAGGITKVQVNVKHHTGLGRMSIGNTTRNITQQKVVKSYNESIQTANAEGMRSTPKMQADQSLTQLSRSLYTTGTSKQQSKEQSQFSNINNNNQLLQQQKSMQYLQSSYLQTNVSNNLKTNNKSSILINQGNSTGTGQMNKDIVSPKVQRGQVQQFILKKA